MDYFKVPKVVNRHVLQAMFYFSELLDDATLSDIKLEVMYTMKNVNPIHELERVIESSLINLTSVGILNEKIGENNEKTYTLQFK